MNLLNLIGFVIFIVLFSLTIVDNVKLRIKNNKNKNEINQLSIDNILLLKKISDLFDEINSKELENTDGFLKFIEQSRDWAFQYIEEVQAALSEFDTEISSIVKWNQTYGTVTDGGAYSDKIKQISLAYDELKKLLPKNAETPNN